MMLKKVASGSSVASTSVNNIDKSGDIVADDSQRAAFSSQLGFILTAIGSAVGLGNIWRFPGVAYENGGGAFLIPYIVALITAGIPILFLEYAIGHRFRTCPPMAFARIKKKLATFGWVQVLICFFIALYYTAVVAWSLSYFVFSFNLKWGEDTANFFYTEFLHLADAPQVSFLPSFGILLPLAAVWIMLIIVLFLDINKGLEKVNRICIPLLAVIFVCLVTRSLFLPGALDGLNAFFTPDLNKLADYNVWLAAYSQIFYSLSVGFGIMLTYSSYRRKQSNQTGAGLTVAFANSSFELTAGIGVFAVIGFMAQQQGVKIDEVEGIKGVALAFITFPKAISQMPGAHVFGILFFGSLLIAGFTSALSILVAESATIQDVFKVPRQKAALIVGIPSAILSCLFFGSVTGLYNLDVIDHWICSLGTLMTGIGICVFTLWFGRKGKELAFHLSSLSTFKVGLIWRFLVSVVNPCILIYVFSSEIIECIRDGYSAPDYSVSFQMIFGWTPFLSTIIVGIILGVVTASKMQSDAFVPYPIYNPTIKKG